MGTPRTVLTRLFLGVSVVAAVASLLTSSASGNDELPRYKLKVGQELVYRTADPAKVSDDGNGGKTTSNYVIEWIVDVAGRDEDGTLWLVFREKITSSYTRGEKETKQELQTDGYFHLTADGRFVENTTIRPMSNPTLLFPALPADVASLKSGWADVLVLDETQRKYHVEDGAASVNGAEWKFIEEPQAALDQIYQSSTVRDYAFDRELGRVRKVVSTIKQGWPASAAEKSDIQTIEFVEARQLDVGDLQAIAEQTRQYFAAVEQCEKLSRQASRDFSHALKWYNEAGAHLKTAGESLTLPWLREMVDSRLEQHARDVRFGLPVAVQFARLIDRPSPEWTTADFDGKPHALADYRGKVVLLDFWYRGCGWCIRAMPQLKQLTDDFAGKDVAILGINADSDNADARFVIDKLKLNYATLKNGEGQGRINTMYKISGWPTLVLIDKQGVVRLIHFGYSPTLRSELGQKIRELLTDPAG